MDKELKELSESAESVRHRCELRMRKLDKAKQESRTEQEGILYEIKMAKN